jgi:hypothetical protein
MGQMEDIGKAYVKEKRARQSTVMMQESARSLPAGVKAANVKIKANLAPREAEEAMRKLAMAHGRKTDIKEEGDSETESSRLSSPFNPLSNQYVNVSKLVEYWQSH